jgi:hypothetical protein
VSGTTVYYSKPISSEWGDGFSLHLVWTGTPTGTFTVWKSNKPDPNPATDADWVQDLDFGTAGSLATGGVADEFAASALNAKNAKWRVKYENASGTGVIFGWATGNRTR